MRRVNRFMLWCALIALVWFVAIPAGSESGQGTYGVAINKDIMVPMRDGVRLATDVYLPTKDGLPIEGTFPTIMSRTPYGKDSARTEVTGRYYASHGYAFVVQDTRGRFKSDGVWHMLNDDGRDGFDAAHWISKQLWSNGKLGMIGTSYGGGTQHAVALEKAPELVTAIPVDAMSNLGYASMRNGGAFELRFWNWIYRNVVDGSRQARDDPEVNKALMANRDNRLHYLANLPLRRGTTPLKIASEYEEWLVEGMSHGVNDEFWIQNNIVDQAESYKDIPLYLVGGWYDSWASNTTRNYGVLSKTLQGPIYLIMGPWIHGQQGRSAHGQVSFGSDAAISDPLAWRLEWYDHWLKGKDNAVGKRAPFKTPVRIFVMGTGDEREGEDGLKNHGGYWREENEWPLARTQYTPYYFHAGGGLAATRPSDIESATTYRFDPRDPVPTIGGNTSSGAGILLQGAWDQRGGDHVWNWQIPIPLSSRNDVVVFQTEPLAEDVEVTGEIEVKLWISSSAPDTDFTAKLLDVHPASPDYPEGFDMNIGDGIIRTRFRDTLRREALMEPGTVYEATIHLYPTSNIFKKGHRIRVDISSSNFPRFDLNPNTGEPLNDNRRVDTAQNTVYHDAEHSSHIVLPIIPKRRSAAP